MLYKTKNYKIFTVFNTAFLGIVGILCLAPFIHILALSFSTASNATAGEVTFLPVNFTFAAYKLVLAKEQFLTSIYVSLARVGLGGTVNIFLTVMLAYPLSKEVKQFKYRTAYTWFFVFTILFNGGLIPLYLVISKTGLLDSIWALVIPFAVPVWNVILMMNFFRTLPKEMEEAAFIDGAGHWVTLFKIYLPMSLAGIATITLFTVVAHWNEWFYGLILMNATEKYPLASYLQTIVIGGRSMMNLMGSEIELLQKVSDRTAKAAQILIGALPILCVYPFLQRYFTKGLVIGSVKG